MQLTTNESIIFWLIGGVLLVLGCVGNLLLIGTVLCSKKLRSVVMNLFLVNLAVADLANLVVASADWSQMLWYRIPVWEFWPESFCQPMKMMAIMFLFSSVLTQVFICVERYVATVYPLSARHICTRHNYLVSLLVIWALAIIFAAPYGLRNSPIYYPQINQTICTMPTPLSIPYKFVEFLMFYVIPMSTVGVLYFQCARRLWSAPAVIRQHESRPNRPSQYRRARSNIEATPTVTPRSNRFEYARSATGTSATAIKKAVQHKKSALATQHLSLIAGRRRVVVMLVSSVICQFICYSPIQLVFLGAVFKLPLQSLITAPVFISLNLLTCAKSALNPLIYVTFSRRFRMEIVAFVTCGCYKPLLIETLRRHATLAASQQAHEADPLSGAVHGPSMAMRLMNRQRSEVDSERSPTGSVENRLMAEIQHVDSE